MVKPIRSPEALAALVSALSNQQKAEITYELVFFAACAADETGHETLNKFLAELEDMADVYVDPEKRRALQKSVRADAAVAAAVVPTLPPASA